jgi:hypothetical protein
MIMYDGLPPPLAGDARDKLLLPLDEICNCATGLVVPIPTLPPEVNDTLSCAL